MFYNTLSNKAKDKFMELWEPEIGQVVTNTEFGGVFGVVTNYCEDSMIVDVYIDECLEQGISTWWIPKADLQLAFDMLEKMGWDVDSTYDGKVELYDCEIRNGECVCQVYGAYSVETRLESLKEALKYALELEVE